MNTIKLYDNWPYDTDFFARITAIDGSTITLDRTLFFPEEGGQTCDHGVIRCNGNEYRVADVQIKDGVIYHTLKGTDGSLNIGDEIEGHIDWEHRFDNMQNHTGEHIFSGLVHLLKGYDNVGFSLTENTCQMDYNGKLTDEEITQLEAQANEVIWNAIPVDCRYPSVEELDTIDYRSKKELSGPVRIVTIADIDICACCAPHVRTTAEVGLLKVISHLNYKGGTRLYIACGKRAFTDYVQTFDSLTDIGHLFSTGRPDALEAVKKLISSDQELRTRLADSERDELMKQIDDNDTGVIFTDITDRNILTAAFNHLKETHDGACYIFSKKNDGGYTFLAGGRDIDARELMPALKELGARGGGKADMVQGSINATADRIMAVISPT